MDQVVEHRGRRGVAQVVAAVVHDERAGSASPPVVEPDAGGTRCGRRPTERRAASTTTSRNVPGGHVVGVATRSGALRSRAPRTPSWRRRGGGAVRVERILDEVLAPKLSATSSLYSRREPSGTSSVSTHQSESSTGSKPRSSGKPTPKWMSRTASTGPAKANVHVPGSTIGNGSPAARRASSSSVVKERSAPGDGRQPVGALDHAWTCTVRPTSSSISRTTS